MLAGFSVIKANLASNMVLWSEVCNFLLKIIVFFGLKVLLWEAGWMAGWPGAGGIGTKTNSAPNLSWVWVWAELGNKKARKS